MKRVGELPAVRAANLRWLAGHRHPRYARVAVIAALAEVFAEPGPLRAGAAEVGDPLAVLPVLFVMLWRGWLSAELDTRVLDSASMVRTTGGCGRPCDRRACQAGVIVTARTSRSGLASITAAAR